MFPKRSDYRYGTHLPLLIEHVLKTSGPVLEQGVGMFSTPILHQLCEGHRILHSLEEDPEWIERFAHLRSSWHVINNEEPALDWYSVVLIDGPTESRVPLLDKIAHRADFIILHDTEDAAYNYPIDYFANKREYAWLIPKTMVVSHFNNVRTRDS